MFDATVVTVNPFSVEFTVPSSLPLGTYSVAVSNDNGNVWQNLEESQTLTVEAVGSDPLGLGVAWAGDFNYTRRFNSSDYASIQAAIDALGAAGGGILDVPNGSYDLAQLQSVSRVIILGQSKSGVKLRFTNSSVNLGFISTKGNGTTLGMVGLANLTLEVNTANASQGFPDHFINFGSSTAEKIFIKDVDILLPQTNIGGARANSAAMTASRYGMIKNLKVNGFRAQSTNSVSRYMEISGCDFTTADRGLIANVANMYTLILNNKIKFTSSLTDTVVKRGFETISHTYISGNTVENCSGTANWYEQIMFEPRLGETKMYGQVASSTVNTVIINPRTKDGVIYGDNGNNNWNMTSPYPSGWYITIVDGKGLGQYRTITALSQANSRVTIAKNWDVLPDSTSKFVISALAVNNITYRNSMRDGMNAMVSWQNGVDTVFADNTSLNTAGFNITTYYVIAPKTEEPNPVAATRFCIAYFNRMTRNETVGTSEVRGISGIGYHHFLSLQEARTEDAYAISCYGTDIKDNLVTSVLPAPLSNSNSPPPINGIYLGSDVRFGRGTKDTVLAGIIENNVIKNSSRGISLGGTLYPRLSGAERAPTASMSRGIVCKGNRFMDVTQNIVDNRPGSTVLIDNATINDVSPPVSVATVTGTPLQGATQANTYAGSVVVSFAASDNASGVRRIEFSMNAGATWTTYEQPITISANGSYSVLHRSIDRVGNTESAKTLTLSIGSTPTPTPEPEPEPTSASIVQWGDSMTALLGAPRLVAALGDSRRVVNRGVGGQRSAEIAGRQGGIPVTCQVMGGQIPASGSVSITSLSPTIARLMASGLTVVIAGVTGILRPLGSDVNSPTGYEFTRSSSGSAVSAAGSQAVVPVTTDLVNGATFDLNSYTQIWWLGRNGTGSNLSDVQIYEAMLEKLTASTKRVLILPIFNGGRTADSNGDPAIPTTSSFDYDREMNRNAAIAAAFPQYYYDIRRDFIDGAEAWFQSRYPEAYARDWGLSFTPSRTQANLGPDSAWDVANDVPPRALRSDTIHLNTFGHEFLAELLAARIKQLESGDPAPTPPPLPTPGTYALQTFDSLQSTTAAGWSGSNSTTNGNNFGWNSLSTIGGGAGGSAGGVIARASAFRWFADTVMGDLNRADTLRMAGSLRLENINFDGTFYLGYFRPSALESGGLLSGFIGIQFAEPGASADGPFRARAMIAGQGGSSSNQFSLNQNTVLAFDLVWRGQPDGSGVLSGTIAGQNVSITAASGTGIFNAFGILNGGMSSQNASELTGTCIFDNLTYRKEAVVTPPPTPTPTPEPPPVTTSALVPDLANQVNPSQFVGEDYKYGYYLKHLPTVANAVLMDGPNRGFINLVVWRGQSKNVPGNARILENHVALAFFYTANKPWNVYRGNQALRARLEAVLEFLISPVNLTLTRGNVDGITQDIGLLGSDRDANEPTNNELAGSAFGVKFLGETLRMLEQSRLAGGPVINENLRQRVIATTRLLIRTLLGWQNFKVQATRFSNQYTGFWGGTLAFLQAHPDATLRQLLVTRLTKLADKNNPEMITWGPTFPFLLSSPAGYHYESLGPEWGYVFNTHYPNIAQFANYGRGTSIMDPVVSMEQSWVEWLSYNAVREPNSNRYTLNRAIQTRLINYASMEFDELAIADSIPMARAFARTSTEHLNRELSRRQQLVNNWPNVGSLGGYNPHAFADQIDAADWRPTEAQRTAAIATLPYIASDRFAHQRVDTRLPFQATFIRRPNYYAAFNAGNKVADTQRFGLGLIWSPLLGSVLQTQWGSVAPWGTARAGQQPAEASSFTPVVKVGGTVMPAVSGARNFPNGGTGVVTFEYPVLGGTKVVTFNDGGISVNVQVANQFIETIPLLVKTTDTVTIAAGVVRLRRDGRDFEIQFPAGVTATTRAADPKQYPPRGFTVTEVRLTATGSLSYTLAFT
jgi:hypothetical protein